MPDAKTDVKQYLKHNYCNSFYCDSITCAELYNVVNSLKNSKSGAADGISSSLIRSCSNEIVYPLTYIFNMSFEQGIFPQKLKIAKVIPIYKKGDTS